VQALLGYINSINCASLAVGFEHSRPAAASVAHGIGTATQAHASAPKAGPTATLSPRSCSTSGIGGEHFAPQPETEQYLNYVADKFYLHKDIQFDTIASSTHHKEEKKVV
jgi:hypothetical protein